MKRAIACEWSISATGSENDFPAYSKHNKGRKILVVQDGLQHANHGES
jgi:hypothetical protein